MRIRALASVAATACLLLSACDAPTTAPAVAERPSAVKYGDPAGDEYPAVVLIAAEVKGVYAFRCSGTLISPTVVLTAGHCVTNAPDPVSGIRVFTESNVQNGDNSFPFAGDNSVEAVSWAAHPEYTDAAFVLHDVGVVVLSEPVVLPAGEYGVLPTVGQLDALQSNRRTVFTAVGYGLQRINPAQVEAAKVRMVAYPHLIQINRGIVGSYSLLLSNNASTGGTCFGDSGGPNYLGDTNVIAGVTSFGLNGTCGGTGGVFRLDRQDVLDFVTGFLRA